VVYGGIIWGHREKFPAMFHRNVAQEEIFQIQTIIVKRMREFRDAIMNTG
jgi:hypothetical protein